MSDNQNEMTQEKAVQLLINGVMLAQRKGVYQLEEAELLSKAVKCFLKKQQSQPQTQQTKNETNITTI